MEAELEPVLDPLLVTVVDGEVTSQFRKVPFLLRSAA